MFSVIGNGQFDKYPDLAKLESNSSDSSDDSISEILFILNCGVILTFSSQNLLEGNLKLMNLCDL